jgi:polysaccharide export outer membrane protein
MGLSGITEQVKLFSIGALTCCMLLCSAIPARAEYLIGVGDALEISVAGVPELRQRVTVELDGSISYPLLGTTFIVDGLSSSAVRAKLRATLPSKVFRRQTPDGRDDVVVIEPDQITINVVEYRPIYVNGDVSKPGEQAYRPLMTVRQAVAVAGGYDLMRFRMENPFLATADLRSEYESLWTEFAKEKVHIWRLEAELNNTGKPEQVIFQGTPLPSPMISQMTRLEAEQLKLHQVGYERQKAFLQRGIKQVDEQINVLSERTQKENAGLQADEEDLRRVRALFDTRQIQITRITEARRALLFSSIQKLQTASELLRAKRERDELMRQLEKLDEQRAIDLRQELQTANVKINQVSARLQAVGEKIEYTALARSQLVRGSGSKPQITVIRKGKEEHQRFLAEDDTELQPGDTIEVALRPERGVALSPEPDSKDNQQTPLPDRAAESVR